MGVDNIHDLWGCSPQQIPSLPRTPHEIPCLYDHGFLYSAHDIFWCQLSVRRNAQLRIIQVSQFKNLLKVNKLTSLQTACQRHATFELKKKCADNEYRHTFFYDCLSELLVEILFAILYYNALVVISYTLSSKVEDWCISIVALDNCCYILDGIRDLSIEHWKHCIVLC